MLCNTILLRYNLPLRIWFYYTFC